MSTFVCSLEGFKKIVVDFCSAAPTADAVQLEAGFKCVGLHYLGITPMPETGSREEIMAVSILEYAGRRKADRDFELAMGGPCSALSGPNFN